MGQYIFALSYIKRVERLGNSVFGLGKFWTRANATKKHIFFNTYSGA